MFFSKKQEGGSGGNNVSTAGTAMSPPKNLPDLARDIYEKDYSSSTTSNSSSTQSNSQNGNSNNLNSNINSNAKVPMPETRSVPKLDLSSLRQNLSSEQYSNGSSYVSNTNFSPNSNNFSNNISTPIPNISSHPNLNINSNTAQIMSNPSNNYANVSSNSSYVQNPVASNPSNSINSLNSMNSINSVNSINSANSVNSRMFNDSTILDDGFFKEFEEHILNNGYDNSIISDLLSQNLLDKMLFYHTAKSDTSPFNASNTELSHAIKIKLEDLKNLERAWIMNNSKLQLMKKFGSAIEYDLSIMSEELKKLLSEAKKRNYSINASSNNVSNFNIASYSNNLKNSASISSENGSNPVDASGFNIFKKKDSPVLSSTNTFNSSNNLASVMSDASTLSASNPVLSTHPVNNPVNISSQNYSTKVIESIAPSVVVSAPLPFTVTSPNMVDAHASSHSGMNPLSKYDLKKYVITDASKFFYCKNGSIYRSLKEAIEGIKLMDDSTFNYHVTDSKNDFSKWIAGVFTDYKLSESLKSLHSRASMLDYLNKTTY